MSDKPDLKDIIKKHAANESAGAIIARSDKISASPLVQGFVIGYICARFPIGMFFAAGAGFLSGLALEENFMIPNLKDHILAWMPEKRKDD